MKYLRWVVPAIATIVLTFVFVVVASWLTRLVPSSDWSDLIKAAIVVSIILGTLLAIAWSAYFTYVIKKSLGG